MARKQIVILGGGTGGTMTANRLRRRFDADEAEIHVIDRDDRHVYQPGVNEAMRLELQSILDAIETDHRPLSVALVELRKAARSPIIGG